MTLLRARGYIESFLGDRLGDKYTLKYLKNKLFFLIIWLVHFNGGPRNSHFVMGLIKIQDLTPSYIKL